MSWNSSLTVLRWIFLSVIGALVTLITLSTLKYPLDLMIFSISKKCLVCSCYFVTDWPLFQILSHDRRLIRLTNIQCACLLICQALLLGCCDCWPDIVSTSDGLCTCVCIFH